MAESLDFASGWELAAGFGFAVRWKFALCNRLGHCSGLGLCIGLGLYRGVWNLQRVLKCTGRSRVPLLVENKNDSRRTSGENSPKIFDISSGPFFLDDGKKHFDRIYSCPGLDPGAWARAGSL